MNLEGEKRIPQAVWDQIHIIRSAVLDSIKTVAPHDNNYVLTNVLAADDDVNLKIYKDVEEVAKKRNALFLPVVLHCSAEELKRRVVSLDRAKLHKLVNPDILDEHMKSYDLIKLNHPNALSLDITDILPKDVAKQILEHIHVLASDT